VRPGDLEKLLGGYATGTLTAEERQALMEAALEDQQLFDALAREEALRDVLSDRAARARLLAALDRQPARWYRRAWSSMPLRAFAAAAALAIAVGAGYWMWHSEQRQAVTEVAVLKPAAIPAPPAAAAENSAAGAPARKEARALARRLPAGSSAFRRNAPGDPIVVIQTAHAGAQSTSDVMGSLVPPPPPAAPAPAPVPAIMKAEGAPTPPAAVPATTETVQVTAANSSPVEPQATDRSQAINQPSPPAARGGGGGAAENNFRPARAPIMSALGVLASGPLQWTVLRRNDSGAFEPIGQGGLREGDTVELRLESSMEGDISLTDGDPAAADSTVLLRPTHIGSGGTVVTPPIEPAGAGLRTFTLRLTRTEGPPILSVVRLNFR
jgi:hypothetical protein